MSQNDQPPPKPLSPGEELGQALQAFADQVIAEATHVTGEGAQQLLFNPGQLLIDIRTLEVKLQAIYEELGREQLIEPEKLHKRTVRLLHLRARELKQVVDARPRVAVASSVITGINGRSHG